MDQPTLRVHIEQRVLNRSVLINLRFENSAMNFTPFGNNSKLITFAKCLGKLVCLGACLEHKPVGEVARDNIGSVHVDVSV